VRVPPTHVCVFAGASLQHGSGEGVSHSPAAAVSCASSSSSEPQQLRGGPGTLQVRGGQEVQRKVATAVDELQKARGSTQ